MNHDALEGVGKTLHSLHKITFLRFRDKKKVIEQGLKLLSKLVCGAKRMCGRLFRSLILLQRPLIMRQKNEEGRPVFLQRQCCFLILHKLGSEIIFISQILLINLYFMKKCLKKFFLAAASAGGPAFFSKNLQKKNFCLACQLSQLS